MKINYAEQWYVFITDDKLISVEVNTVVRLDLLTNFMEQSPPWEANIPSQSYFATDGRSVSQSVSLGVQTLLGLMTKF
jgi:hypothetical protein